MYKIMSEFGGFAAGVFVIAYGLWALFELCYGIKLERENDQRERDYRRKYGR